MIDISGTGNDIRLFDTQVPKASNILSVQLGALEYAQDLGIDMKYFLNEDLEIQNASFNSYLIEVLARNGINVADMTTVIKDLYEELKITISPDDTGGGLIAQ